MASSSNEKCSIALLLYRCVFRIVQFVMELLFIENTLRLIFEPYFIRNEMLCDYDRVFIYSIRRSIEFQYNLQIILNYNRLLLPFRYFISPLKYDSHHFPELGSLLGRSMRFGSKDESVFEIEFPRNGSKTPTGWRTASRFHSVTKPSHSIHI